jgi:hypothetical protein
MVSAIQTTVFVPFDASKIGKDLPQMPVIGAAELILNDDSVISLVRCP